jgi:hypothetical protein
LDDLEHESFVLVLGGADFDAVHFQEYDCGDRAHSFVAIDERVVLDEVKQVGRGHFKQIGVEILARKHGPGLGDCRLQKSPIANPKRAAISRNLVAMDFQDFIQEEKIWLCHSASLLSARPYFRFVPSRAARNRSFRSPDFAGVTSNA